tara:strand:+ start:6469 stop:7578 length:1110 start_codon:yes stop_codon:yes gene_type:complete
MIDAIKLLSFLKKKKVNFFSGVADSSLKAFTKELEKEIGIKHFPVYNEGSAVSLGIGYHLSTGKIPCVYLQNSGLSNAINPLVSIAHKQVYSIPLILIIGWRGSPFLKSDEPQHNVKGKITRQLLKLLNIKYFVLRNEKDLKKFGKLINYSKRKNQSIGCLVERNTLFTKKYLKQKIDLNFDLTREIFIKNLLKHINSRSKIISTTGYTSREVYKIRKDNKLFKGKDFYMVGGMGHSSMVALGVSLKEKKKNIICLDGDGSILMHFGSMKVSGLFGKSNFKHVLFNNASHESVGGQRTYVENLKFSKIAKLLGYKYVSEIRKKTELTKKLKKFLKSKGPSFLEVKTKSGTLKNLGRPKDLLNIKNRFKR